MEEEMESADRESTHRLELALGPVQDAGEFGAVLRRLLRRARESTGRRLTCRELSELTGYGRSSVNNWLEGRSLPSADGLGDLLIALDATCGEQRLLATARDQIEDRRRAAARTRPEPAGHDPQARPGVVPRELPPDVTAFTGRAAELASLDGMLAGVRAMREDAERAPVVISAVSGTAGVGKTALAVRWAHQVVDYFPDGQLYVNLRGFDPDQPLPAGEALARFLRTLGIQGQDVPPEVEERSALYRSLLSGKQMLIVLDNAASAEHVRPLLPGAGPLVVVTSRDSLAGLVARDGAHRLDLSLLPVDDAVALLCNLIGDRVAAEPAAAVALAEACARLPVALRVAAELAVTRPSAMLAELAAELAGQQDRLDRLDAGGDVRTAVRSVFSWSYRNLPPSAARAFRLIGLHPGPDWDRHAAAALTACGLHQIDQLLGELSRAHLIQPGAGGRYIMHDMLRAYAAGLAAEQDSDATRQAALTSLSDYYLAAAVAAMDLLFPAEQDRRPRPPPGIPTPGMTDSAAARAWLAAELATLVGVVTFTATHGWPGHAGRLAATLNRFLQGGYGTEAIIVHAGALRAAQGQGDRAAQARALNHLGSVYKQLGRQQEAGDYLQQSLVLAREIGDRAGEARSLGSLGNVHERQGHYSQAGDCFGHARLLFREIGDRLGEARSLGNLALINGRQGRYQQAADCHHQALAVFREMGDRLGEARTLGNLGDVYCRQALYEQALEHHHQALGLFREIGDQAGEADAQADLGAVYERQGLCEHAIDCHLQALDLFRKVGDLHGQARTLAGLGTVYQQQGACEKAEENHQEALTLSRRIGDHYGEARALTGLGAACQRRGDFRGAAELHRQALALFREMGDRGGEAGALNGTGEALAACGQGDQARARHAVALALARETGDRYEEARALAGLGVVGQRRGDPPDPASRQHAPTRPRPHPAA
jgi:tetratricopeptide (TPR) repeat protein/transcriptional regulator with XRE-family HTH domain